MTKKTKVVAACLFQYPQIGDFDVAVEMPISKFKVVDLEPNRSQTLGTI